MVGVLTALCLTGISVVAYVLYCEYLDGKYRSSVILYSDSDVTDEGQAITVVMNDDGTIEEYAIEGTPDIDQLRSLCVYHYVLYKELLNNQLAREGKVPYLRYQDMLFGEMPPWELSKDMEEEKAVYLREEYVRLTEMIRGNVENHLTFQEEQFSTFNKNYDYWILDHAAPNAMLTNTEVQSISGINPTQYAFLFQVDYDEHGVATIPDKNILAGDIEALRKNLNSVLHEKNWQMLGGMLDLQEIEDTSLRAAVDKACVVKNPAGCSVIIGITKTKYQLMNGFSAGDGEWSFFFAQFASLSVESFCVAILLFAAFSGLFYLNSRSEEKRAKRVLARAPVELVVALILLLHGAGYPLHRWLTSLYLRYEEDYVSASLFAFFLCIIAWYVGGCIGEIRIIGFRTYFRKRFLFLIIWRAISGRMKKLYEEYRSVNLGMDLRRKILRLVIVNALIVSLFCAGWLFGILGVIVYSVFLYFLVMKYVIAVQKDYQELRRMTKEMAEGNLKYEPEKSLGLFEPAKEDLVQIRNGFNMAVQEEVKSHKMKTELITNVSHDLKTPLTAIITYVNLLKEKDLTKEQIEQYVNTLDQKSLRLKRLIEDLFEVSKANSGNVQLNIQNCDLVNLIKQCYYEVEEKLEAKNLTARLTMPEGKVSLKLDGEKTYRIYENLFNNIAKYAMAGTRVYVAMAEEEDRVTVTIKNITEAELYVPAEELTERFVRGDASRGTVEGSGLGLAIARSFTELQGGKFEIEVDGDLFKVTTIWRKN